MKKVAISGSWRYDFPELKKDVESIVQTELKKGNRIITGGAPGVDFIATNTVLEYGNPQTQLQIYLPTSLKILLNHYKKRIAEGIIELYPGKKIISQLENIEENFPKSVFDATNFSECNTESYFARNATIIENCDILYAFCVDNSQGTMDAYNKAKKQEKEVHLKKYTYN